MSPVDLAPPAIVAPAPELWKPAAPYIVRASERDLDAVKAMPFMCAMAGGYRRSDGFRVTTAGSWNGSSYMNRSFGVPTSSIKWSLNFYFRRSGGFGSAQRIINVFDGGSVNGFVRLEEANSLRVGANNFSLITTQTFTDAAYRHVCVHYDSAQTTASDRAKLWVDGVLVTSFSSSSYPPQNANAGGFNTANPHTIGRINGSASEYFNGLIAEMHFHDGTLIPHTAVRGGDGKPLKYTGGNYGNNGFYLNFVNSGSLGADASGVGNNWTNSGVTQSSTVP